MQKDITSVVRYEMINQAMEHPVWKQELLFVICIEGTMDITVQNKTIAMKQGEIVLVLPFQHYCIQKMQGCCLMYYLNQINIEERISPEKIRTFVCNSAEEQYKERYQTLVQCMVESVIEKISEGDIIGEKKFVYTILHEMLHNFSTPIKEKEEHLIEDSDRISQILNYIEENYKKELTLSDLAKHFYLSNSYISRILKNELGINFLKYLNRVRLMHANVQLQDRKKTIEQIAHENGFKNGRAFSTVFKEYYGVLPSEYHKNKANALKDMKEMAFTEAEVKEKLQQFLSAYQAKYKVTTEKVIKKKVTASIDVSQTQLVEMSNTHKILTIRKANHLLLPQIRESVKHICSKLGFREIYFHEVFNDEMEMYYYNNKNEPCFNFYKIDQILDFIKEIGAVPYIELSFVPFIMAENQNAEYYIRNSISSMPRDMDEWKNLVQVFIQHLIDRYGTERVKTWKFSVWNSPDNPDMNKSAVDVANYQKLYKITYDTVKACNEMFQVGTSALMNVNLFQPEWMNIFSSFYKKENCIPDYVMVNMYMMDATIDDVKTGRRFPMSQDPEALSCGLAKIRENNEQYGWGIKDLVIPEWDFDLFFDNVLEEMNFKAAYVIKNLVDCCVHGNKFGVVNPRDRYPDQEFIKDSFNLQNGMITYDGIYKSVYYAYQFLNELGNELVSRNHSYIITRKGKEIQILMYHYIHYSKEYAKRDLKVKEEITKAFDQWYDLEIEMHLENLDKELYRKETAIIDLEHGNAYGFVKKDWSAKPLNQEDISYINQVQQPLRKKEFLQIDPSGKIVLTERLSPLEIRFIKLIEA